MELIKRIVKILPFFLKVPLSNLYQKLFDIYAFKSYSQEGEDMILRRIFEGKKKGFYVDVGAHHPKRFSNTYFFYKKGWSGINIDAMPGSMCKFHKLRPRDINLEFSIGTENKVMRYYIFNEPALNGFNEVLSIERDKANTAYKIQESIELQTYTLAEILNEYMPLDQKVDFLSVDVEGHDLEVLKSNNWDKFKPDVVLVEALSSSCSGLMNSDITHFMTKLGYVLYAKAVNTVIYRRTQY